MTCPKCGRLTAEGAFCERCGAELSAPVADAAPVPVPAPPPVPEPARVPPRTMSETPTLRVERRFRPASMRPFAPIDAGLRAVDARIERETSDEALLRKQRGEPTIEYDRQCVLFENLTGIIRFRFDPLGGGERVENVIVTLSNPACEKPLVQRFRHADRVQEFPIQFPPQAAGLQSWEIRLEYLSTQRKHELVGQFQVFVKPVESRKRGSDNFNINIQTNIGDVGHASDVTVNQRGAEELAKLVAAVDPYEEMSRIIASGRRDWEPIPLSDDNEVVSLPEQPFAARTDRVVLDFGNGRRIHLFAERTVLFGKRREDNDFVLRPARPINECSEQELRPYQMVSRRHCFFEHSGERMTITDGSREANGVIRPSTNGTFWNDDQIRGSLELAAGMSGVVSFGAPTCAGGLSMDLKVCGASKACATCPHSNIHWCGEGKRPSLMLTRRDGLPEKYVAVWSCFWLGDADPSLDGVVIFRKGGAFAFRDTYRSGWFVPGTDIQTDYGTVKVLNSQLSTLNS